MVLVFVLAGCSSESSNGRADASPALPDAAAMSDAATFDDAAPRPADAMTPDGTSPSDAGPVLTDASITPGDSPFVARVGSYDGAFLDQFGLALALSDEGRLLAVGAPNHDQSAWDDGAVYLFRRDEDTWTLFDKLKSDPVEYGHFGESIAATDDMLVIGAPGSNMVHVYTEDVSGRWVETAVLTPPGPSLRAYLFGHSVAVDGETIVVGTFPQPTDEVPGAAYVFEKQGATWISIMELGGSEVQGDDRFGHKVLLRGDRLFVSAYGYKQEGVVYEFHREADSTWRQVGLLMASDTNEPHRPTFGASLALQNDTLVVGAIHADGESLMSGAAYVFREGQGTWQPTAKLVDPDGRYQDLFGMAVEIVDDRIFVGSIHSFADTSSAPGSVLVFVEGQDGTWHYRDKLIPRFASSGSWFGMRLSVSSGLLAVGSVREPFDEIETGVVHIVDVSRAAASVVPP